VTKVRKSGKDANRGIAEIFGYDVTEIVGQTPGVIVVWGIRV